MTDILKKLLLASLLVANVSYAASNKYTFESKSLIGIEGAYSSMDVEDGSAVVTAEKPLAAGLKIGAQTHNVRLFLSFRNVNVDSFDSAYMYGAELQYLFNFSEKANFFIGANYGRMSISYEDSLSNAYDFTTGYMGGGVGFNLHLSESVDFEFGSRLFTLSESEDIASSYKFGDITMNYMSLIFRYEMD